ncbi:16S rRNA (guanine(527)-N(7))-methyltransferase RsmG [Mycoplasma sp. 1654_15]|uniref:16S rRNA (guanine(527)-N(7))-methyltransferase RsmG n=1 Tax=Mycoplasma sp. 1654_15 TaxID=2725994 RepID=UPI0014498CA1|nr:16S rRNA (guanine(527)-N(7))-methyltransferase RsmG [Mycoplasma sp. 1654_15]QJB71470.1 16S rRNA (guanine(527)-N(7))-methyltransferase RsmG [Mycoplasma sp. 1654_15]
MLDFKEKTRQLVNNEQIFWKLEQYVNLIEEKNKVMNLTGFSEDQLWKEGIYESIICLQPIIKNNKNSQSLLDVGAGAGFPSIPFLIFNTSIKLTIIEKLKKRCNFLELVKEKLNLDFEIINDSVSNLDKNFDFITARAVGSINFLFKITKKLQKPTTSFIYIKGPKVFEEILEAKNALIKFDYKVEKINSDMDKQIFIFRAQKK